MTYIESGYLKKTDVREVRYPHLDIQPLIVSEMKQHPATGTFPTYPAANLNDGSVITNGAAAEAIDQYAEIYFGGTRKIKQWRQHGNSLNNADGVWKLQYWNMKTLTWTDWITGISTFDLVTWTEWSAPGAGVKETNKIRLVCTTLDSNAYGSICQELEVKY